MVSSGELDKRWLVTCQTEDGIVLAHNLTKQEAIEMRKMHTENSMEKPLPGMTTLHLVRVEHPDLAINKLDIIEVMTRLGVSGGVAAFTDVSTNLLLIDEFFEKYSTLPRTVIKQDREKQSRVGILHKLLGGKGR